MVAVINREAVFAPYKPRRERAIEMEYRLYEKFGVGVLNGNGLAKAVYDIESLTRRELTEMMDTITNSLFTKSDVLEELMYGTSNQHTVKRLKLEECDLID